MKKMLNTKQAAKAIVLGVGIAGMFMLPTVALGAAAGPCVNCHTMHNSQDGGNVVGTDTPNGALIAKANGCVGCHTSTNNTENVQTNIPMVMHTGAPAATANGGTLAGGSFYWVNDSGGNLDSKGHNVVGIATADATIGQVPPGWNVAFDANGVVGPTWASNQLTCAGTYGCHGDHTKDSDFSAVTGSHHADDSTIDGSTVAKSYRFLLGIKGIEDSDWEDTVAAGDHNQYYAAHRAEDTEATADSASINYLCAECHGDFHSGAGDLGIDADGSFGAAWLRHPTDIDMNNALVTGTEYASYTTYNPLAPVGSSNGALVENNVTTAGNAVVLCLSCHRAHGTEYADLLRWDYTTCNAGTNDAACGCFVCHSTKDAG
ncbi:MAG: hypothetical protein KQH63_11045 [Desulfobulbaceae bacterium]|nr:hypothetical protein [Desulfobulbaceae bacterium]